MEDRQSLKPIHQAARDQANGKDDSVLNSIGASIEQLKNMTITELKVIIRKLKKLKTNDARDAIKIIESIVKHKRGILSSMGLDRLIAIYINTDHSNDNDD